MILQPPMVRSTRTHRPVLRAWIPYGLLVLLVLIIGIVPIKKFLDTWALSIPWPGLHNEILRVAPAVKAPGPYPALFNFNFFTASGTATMVACILAALALGMSPGQLAIGVLGGTPACTATGYRRIGPGLGISPELLRRHRDTRLAFAATGTLFPFFSSLLGWLGVFLTGSDTSANALFGNLQVVTAGRLI